MRASRESRVQLRLASTSFLVLMLVAAGVLLWVSREHHAQFDWTRGGRNSLSEASRNLLRTVDKPVHITAFASEQSGLRKDINSLVSRYQKQKPDITLEFVDPNTDPTRTRNAGVRIDGELVIESNGRKENLNQLTEQGLTNVLGRLARGGERWVVFLSGHGERSPDHQAGFDLSSWAAQLNKRGLKTRTITLVGQAVIPENTSVLVIAGPKVKYLTGERKQIEQYLARGGNLLWLADPGSLQGLEPVAESLGVELERGVVIDPASQVITGKGANFIVMARYGSHPTVQGFDLATLFPDTAGLSVQAPKGWTSQVILDTAPTSWIETGPLDRNVRFDAGQDRRGPISIAVSLTRKQEAREQRVVVTGDGDFISNSFIGEGGNLDFAMNIMNWLASDDAFINVPTRMATDQSLNLSRNSQLVIALGFLVVLPIGLFAAGITLWWRRRKR